MTSQSNGEGTDNRDGATRKLHRGIVLETLQTLGFDIDDVSEMQKDILFLRRLRQTSEAASGKTMTALIGLFFTAIGALLAIGLNSYFNGKH